MTEIDFKATEEKWQSKWEKEKIFEVKEDSKKPKFYVLEMFPYPSATGLHMGHAFNFTIGDVFARFKLMQGFNVMHPMGFDSLGLPAENAAIKAKTHPEDYTNNSIKNFIKQQKALGLTYNWSRTVNTADPDYYKWDQWIFLKMFEKGLVYQKEAPVNWCPKCNTILANEQVQNGKCWRHEDTEVEIRQMNQWFLKITDYAERLLEGHKGLRWPEKTIAMQKNWIGKSHGTEINFEINEKTWPIFTTRPDTIFGVTFMVVSAQHQRLMELVTKEQKSEVEKFLKKLKSVSEKELGDMEKEGVFTGSYAINPANGDKVPVYAGNFVVADYGAGMVMAVPAHDQRDFEFAKKYKIPVKQVVAPYFLDINNPPKQGKENTKRDIVHVIVLNKSGDKFIALKNKKLDWVTPITGGIEKGEDALVAAEREIKEESGYQNFILERQMPYKMLAEFYASHKDVNRSVSSNVLIFRLKDDKQLPLSKEESEKHEVIWLPISELKSLHPVGELNEILSWFSNDSGAFTDSGKLINSKEFNGISNEEAKNKIADWLISKKLAKKVVNFKLRDWSVARQRYWGTPIPLIHCEKCGIVPVSEKDLPVKLPKEVKFGEGNPLLSNESWLNVKCPKCNGKARREANTMDTFVNSSWYFLRYCDSKNNKEIFAKDKVKYWMPIDLYIGGAEHACMHLIYSRFYTMFLHDIGLIDFDEPAPRLFHQGMINGYDGQRMSKSKGNGVEPLETLAKYGVDTTRFYLLSEASPDKGFNWTDTGIQGSLRIIRKICGIADSIKIGKDSEELKIKLNRTIKNITEQIEKLDYRKSTIELRELFDLISTQPEISKETFESSIKLLAPFCPHISEELWEKLGNKGFISLAEWPKAKEIVKERIQEDLNKKFAEYAKQIISKLEVGRKISTVYLYIMPFEKSKVDEKIISKTLGNEVKLYTVDDANKYDPENRAKKAKPGMPGLFIE
jgi:leucyl-tRNA synthetase